MAAVSAAKRSIAVTLRRPDGPAQILDLPEGATLADLIREGGVAIRNPELLRIDGRRIDEFTTLQPGMTITIEAAEVAEPSDGSWRTTVGMFSHPDFLREVIAEGRAIREADREAARDESGQDDR